MKVQKAAKNRIILCAVGFAVILTAVLLIVRFSAQRKEPVKAKTDQDAREVYQIAAPEDLEGFIRKVRDGETELDARLTADIFLNDTSDYENWGQTPPSYQCPMISEYGGTFDGNGYALIGYYSAYHPVFEAVTEGGCIRDLNLRLSYVSVLYENRDIPDEESGADDEANIDVAAGLCGFNYGKIENCAVEGNVLGDGMAAGIVAYNGGLVKDCSFSGTVEGGRCMLRPEESFDIDRPRWHAGGIAVNNSRGGTISGCVNRGEITLHTGGLKIWRSTNGYADRIQIESCAGGLAGRNNGLVADCTNEGTVSSARVLGGIAGANSGDIRDCANKGSVVMLPESEEIKVDYMGREEYAAAGISGYNTGSISNCYNAGSVCMEEDEDRGYVYGISQNVSVWFDNAGGCENCYYLAGRTEQRYRYSGVYQLSEREMEDIEAYLYGERALTDTEGYRTLYASMDVAGTGESDYIRLSVGPDEDMVYKVKAGDSLWKIAEDLYGDGSCYDRLILPRESGGEAVIHPEDEVTAPRLEYYLLRALDERSFGGVDARGKDGSIDAAAAFAKKESAGWLYVYYLAETAGDKGMSVIAPSREASDTWLKPDEEPAIFPSCIFFQVTANEAGDFFAGDWKKVQESIRDSAAHYLGEDCWGLRFYRYTLDNGEKLYGYSFRCYAYQPGKEEKQVLDCAAFYRMRDGLLAEFIGVEEHQEGSDLLAAVRYLAAIVDQRIDVTEAPKYDHSMYLGRENWAFAPLHNPFAIVKNR